jgi:two-component SAPR family response regulator
LVHRAIVNLEDGRIDQSVIDLNAAEDKDAKNAQLVFARARIALAEQRFSDACTLWERNLAMNGVTETNITSLLRCFEKLTDQVTSRHAYALLPEIESNDEHLPAPLRKQLSKVVASLRERFTPKLEENLR